ncbi:MAG: DUF4173 domain-containing protein [Armatimonadota bacterium]
MKVAKSHVIGIVSLAAILGGLAQDLLLADSIGLNLAILCVAVSVGVVTLSHLGKLKLGFNKWMLHAPLWIAAYGFAFTSSAGSDALNLILLVAVVGWLGLRGMKNQALSTAQSLLLGPVTSLIAPFLPFLLPSMTDWKSGDNKPYKVSAGAITGAALAIPALLVFGSILGSADPVFARSISLEWLTSSETIGQRILILGSVSFVACGMLMMISRDLALAVGNSFSSPWPSVYDIQSSKRMEIQGPPAPTGLKVANRDSVSAFVVFFGCIGSLFTLFVLFQARYLFGGNDVVLKTENLSYADYARRGFFELVTVAVMTLPMLMFWQDSLHTASTTERRPVRWVVLAMSGLLGLMLVSAAYRMSLYVSAYGLTTLRFYVSAAMGLLMAVIGGYAWLGSKWKLSAVPHVTYISLMGMVLVTNLVRPDSLIAVVNLTRQQPDTATVLNLGFDADSDVRRLASKELVEQWAARQSKESKNWRGLSVQELRK